MTPESTIDYRKFRLSLSRLVEQHENLLHADETLPRLDREARAESVIQRFEVCYDCLWKVLKRYLMHELGLADVPNSPKPILRIADGNDLFESPCEQWMRYANARVDTTHDYDGEKARAALELIPDFIMDAIALYRVLTGEPWNDTPP